MGAGREHVGRMRRRYAATGRVPEHGRPGRRKSGSRGPRCSPCRRRARTTVCTVLGACAEHMCGAVRLEGILVAQGIRVPHSTIHAMPGRTA